VMLTGFAYMIKGGLAAWPKRDCQVLIGRMARPSKNLSTSLPASAAIFHHALVAPPLIVRSRSLSVGGPS
jgi:hypothetical protein